MERDDITTRKEADRAAEEAGSIGGEAPGAESGDPADQPVEEAGGGEAEGFEQAEAAHRENAEHGDGVADPAADAMPDEPEAGLSGAAYGEADAIESTETQDRQAERDAELEESPPPHE